MEGLPKLQYLGVNALKTNAPPKSPTSLEKSPTVIGPWTNVCSDFSTIRESFFCAFAVYLLAVYLAVAWLAYYIFVCWPGDCCHQSQWWH